MRPRIVASGVVGLVLLLGGAAVLTVANAADPKTGVFNEKAQNAKDDCISHQTVNPNTKYTGGAKADTGRVLRMMRYYVVNGNKSFCDGKPATAVDRSWAQLFVDLGADPAKVNTIRGAA